MTEPAPIAAVGAADIDAAARVVAPFAVRTPLLSFPVLNERVGTKVFLKPEMLQRTGSFKFRGAFNKLAVDPAGQARRRRGRVLLRQPRPGRGGGGEDPQHAGDHRDACGLAASPSASAPRPMAPRSCSTTATRKTAKPSPTALPRKRGATLVRPYDDPFVIAGQGTAGREIAEDMAALGLVARYRGGAGVRRRADRGRRDRREGEVSAGADHRRRAQGL